MKRLRNYFIWLVVLYLLISGVKVGIPYIRNAMFSDAVDNIARWLNYDGTVPVAENRLLKAAEDNKIPITGENFVVVKDPATKYTLVEVKYSVTVSTPFKFYTHVWNFNPRAEYGKR